VRKNYICIVCPQSCDIVLEIGETGDMTVSGNRCPRGSVYAENEYREPKRMITTTVRIDGARIPLLPVIGTGPVQKERLRDCLDLLYKVSVKSPVKMGDVIVRDIDGSGVDIVAARSL
jgi:CxxC motif-containing protein